MGPFFLEAASEWMRSVSFEQSICSCVRPCLAGATASARHNGKATVNLLCKLSASHVKLGWQSVSIPSFPPPRGALDGLSFHISWHTCCNYNRRRLDQG